MKRWMLALVVFLAALPVGAATDAFFAGRSLRMTRIDTGKCTSSAYSCSWFDTSNKSRFWDGTNDTYVATANATDGGVMPPKGTIVYSTGTAWRSLSAPTGRQVLAIDKTDGGLKWVSPTDGGLVLP
jgi:hypothetical protein